MRPVAPCSESQPHRPTCTLHVCLCPSVSRTVGVGSNQHKNQSRLTRQLTWFENIVGLYAATFCYRQYTQVRLLSVCVWNIAQMMLFNYTCSEEMTAVPFFSFFPWDKWGRGAVLDSDHTECEGVSGVDSAL